MKRTRPSAEIDDGQALRQTVEYADRDVIEWGSPFGVAIATHNAVEIGDAARHVDLLVGARCGWR